jgi:predicted alpha-1,6-mannanase (GH76 family)
LTLDFISYIRKSGQTPKTDWEGLFKKNLELTYKLHSSSSFLNSYYDDEGWWALAWVKAYDVFKNNTYLQMARIIFQDMTRGWDESVCNGGVWWDKKKTYKNAIPNELFMSLATKLYLRTNETGFYDWAMKAYSWFYHTGMLNA